MKNIYAVLLTLLALCAISAGAPALASATCTPSGATFTGDMESTLTNNWELLTELGAPVPVQSTATARCGTHSAKATVSPGQQRSELQARPGGTTLKVFPGTTAWFANSIRTGAGFPTTAAGCTNCFQTVMQWKGLGGTQSTSPPVGVEIRNGRYYLYGGFGCPSGPATYAIDLASAAPGFWKDFEFQIKVGTAGVGWVDAYVNNVLVVNHYFPPCGTIYPSPYSEYLTLRAGYYRDPAINTAGNVYNDEYRMGATRASVSLYP